VTVRTNAKAYFNYAATTIRVELSRIGSDIACRRLLISVYRLSLLDSIGIGHLS
jgi:hypothetical protein